MAAGVGTIIPLFGLFGEPVASDPLPEQAPAVVSRADLNDVGSHAPPLQTEPLIVDPVRDGPQRREGARNGEGVPGRSQARLLPCAVARRLTAASGDPAKAARHGAAGIRWAQ